jgi:hypothetical protein
MIRAISIEEVEKFSELGRWFYERMELTGTFNKEVFCQNWRKLIGGGAGFILGRFDEDDNPQECLGVIEYPDVFSGEPTACNMFWFYLEEPKGLEAGMLYRALEFDCVQRKIKHLHIGVLCNDRLARVGGFLLKSGYQLSEMQYRKDL